MYTPVTPSNLKKFSNATETISLARDYYALREAREQWLTWRHLGERRVMRYTADTSGFDIEAQIQTPNPLVYNAVTSTNIRTDMYTILYPQSLNQGLLSDPRPESDGHALLADLARYDAALLLCMEGCLSRPSAAAAAHFLAYEYEPGGIIGGPVTVGTRELYHRVVSPEMVAGDGYWSEIEARYTPVDVMLRLPTEAGRVVAKRIFDEVCPARLPSSHREVAWTTARAWLVEMMRCPETERARWLVDRMRIGLISHYRHDRVHVRSVFPTAVDPAVAVWRGIAEGKNKNAPVLDAIGEIADWFVPPAGSLGNRAVPPDVIAYDATIRAASVFYAPVTMPLVVACACCVMYLTKLSANGVAPGTQNLETTRGDRGPVEAPDAREAALVCYSAYITHHLNMSLGGLAGEHGPVTEISRWSPCYATDLHAPTWSGTAQRLIAAWRERGGYTSERWVRALTAAMLVIDGDPEKLAPPKKDSDDE